MEERTLELTIISAEGLKKVSTFGHDTCYAVAYIYSSEKTATKVDRDGGVNPTWNDKLTIACDNKLLQRGGSYITVEIYSFGSFSNKLVGTSKISLVDIGQQLPGESQPIAVEVRRPSGKVKGVLNVAVKVGETRTVTQRNQSGQAFAGYTPQNVGSPAEYPPIYPPQNWNTQTTTPYPPPQLSGYGYGAVAANGVPVYPPPNRGSDFSEPNYAGAVYPPPKPSRDSMRASSDGSVSRKEEEPVIAYPASGVAGAYQPQQYGYGPQYGPQYNGPQYAPGPQQYYPQGPQQYYPNTQSSYGYQQPSGRQGIGSSAGGAGLGLLGGVLGGLLLGDVIGNIF